jgi:ribosomal protein L11 methylase PrmA
MEQIVKDSARAAGIDAPLEFSWADAFEEDWEAQVKASYVPMRVLAGVWVVPDWYAHVISRV